MIIQPDFLTIRPILGAAPMTVSLEKAAALSSDQSMSAIPPKADIKLSFSR
jgi:hypothetical protein